MDLPIWGISYAWNRVIFALLCLMQIWHNVFRFHPSCNMYPSLISLLGLNNIPVGLPWWLSGKSICLQCRRPRFDSWVGNISWEKKLQPTPVFLPGKSHGQRSLLGYSPWGLQGVGHDWAPALTKVLVGHLHWYRTGPCGAPGHKAFLRSSLFLWL